MINLKKKIEKGKAIIIGNPAYSHPIDGVEVPYVSICLGARYGDTDKVFKAVLDGLPEYDTVIWRQKPKVEYFNRDFSKTVHLRYLTQEEVAHNLILRLRFTLLKNGKVVSQDCKYVTPEGKMPSMLQESGSSGDVA